MAETMNGAQLGDVITVVAGGETRTIHLESTGTMPRLGVPGGIRHLGGRGTAGPHADQYASWNLDDVTSITVVEPAEQYRIRWGAEAAEGERRAAEVAGHDWDPDAPERGLPAYDRATYERVCAALGVEARPDDHPFLSPDRVPACDRQPYMTSGRYLTGAMAIRRWRGLRDEHEADVERRRSELAAAGLADGPLGRADYERACAIMGVAPLTDPHCLVVENEQASRRIGMGFTTLAGLPHEGPAAELAERRGQEIVRTAPPVEMAVCDECGVEFPAGTGMHASMGLACDVDCYDAMADRSGRHARAVRSH